MQILLDHGSFTIAQKPRAQRNDVNLTDVPPRNNKRDKYRRVGGSPSIEHELSPENEDERVERPPVTFGGRQAFSVTPHTSYYHVRFASRNVAFSVLEIFSSLVLL
ncbi:uncharacterized protein MCYG_01898 [Microsporum canis CBS 113480]|uniref:Uncharacterized protein n=1 Tax=Arthroderma otae (strain ATCC MYA-4605 / CBS 113480) TaxID=554155 RepID=C5FI99_ARTOC|nr:uncharacterized protein MCYG_01898 [Microsporum canis CBS 113480]EEQ29079.1 predicted protein [Microsporum canis CBS 113480]